MIRCGWSPAIGGALSTVGAGQNGGSNGTHEITCISQDNLDVTKLQQELTERGKYPLRHRETLRQAVSEGHKKTGPLRARWLQVNWLQVGRSAADVMGEKILHVPVDVDAASRRVGTVAFPGSAQPHVSVGLVRCAAQLMALSLLKRMVDSPIEHTPPKRRCVLEAAACNSVRGHATRPLCA